MTERVEAELKFWAADDQPLRALAAAPLLGPAQLGPARVVDELDRYLDTVDRRLAAAPGLVADPSSKLERALAMLTG